jgi:hypothetical protein
VSAAGVESEGRGGPPIAALIFLACLLLIGFGSFATGGLPAAPPVPTPSPPPAPLATATAAPSPSPSPTSPRPPIAVSPSTSPSPVPSPLPARLTAGELPPDSAALTFTPEAGFATTIEPLQASCNHSADSLGLIGARLEGPIVARYQISIAPFRGDGQYRTNATEAEIGGTVAATGQLQLFIGPPYEKIADVARAGALGQLRFSGMNVDGRRVDGLLRWECAEVKDLG